MQLERTKCVIVLSSKSAGSSAVHDLLASHPQVRPLSKTEHYENETLYWTKAASILRLPQVNMLDSEVPFSPRRARAALIRLLTDNLTAYTPPTDNEELIYGGWRLLCQAHAPIFLEKSPHHLHQWSALALLLECMRRLPEVDFRIVGLVRDPMDTLYSMWTRWRSIPEHHQYEWLTAYQNLVRLRTILGSQLLSVRYEQIVAEPACLQGLFDFIGVPARAGSRAVIQ
jgi:hypothetical protein